MTEIETLLKGAIEKGIGAKPSVGEYSIDMDYIKDGVKYTITKKKSIIIIITRNIKQKTVRLDFNDLPFQKKDTVDILTAIENQLNDYKIFL
jgi:hypothetical protein